MVQVQHGVVEGVVDVDAARQVVSLRRQLVAELVGLGATMCAAMDAVPGFVPCGHAFGVVIEGLAASAASMDAAELTSVADDVRARSEHVSDHRGVACGEAVDVLGNAADGVREVVALLQAAGLEALPAMEAGVMSDELDVALVRALAALGRGNEASAEATTQAEKALALSAKLLG